MRARENFMLIGSKWGGAFLLASTLLAGCQVSAPSVTGSRSQRAGAPVSTRAASAPVEEFVAKPLRGAENAGKHGYYTVKPGDTLTHIGLENGQSVADLVRWNSISNEHVVEVGQVLRVSPPEADGALASASAASKASQASAKDNDLRWAWPSNGSVIAPFNEGQVKGLLIGGKAGDPVYAAADGRVVYAGSGLRGYGNLVIVKHNNVYLSAYAHNQIVLVKEDQSVRRGQKIAAMGSTESDKVELEFEIRKSGKPIDPAKLLPQR